MLKGEWGHSCCAFFRQSEIKTCLYSAALPLPSESFDSVISDIPFGKKFKTTNDAQLLPDILQEMERYVWPLTGLGFDVSGTMVCDLSIQSASDLLCSKHSPAL